MDVQTIIDDLNRLAALQSESNRLAAQIPHATSEQKRSIGQRLTEMQNEINGKHVEGDRT